MPEGKKMKVYTVAQVNAYVKGMLDAEPFLQRIVVRGEISNYSRNGSSGHAYFTLKGEDGTTIAVTMFNSNVNRVGFELQNGLAIFILGNISLYEPSGKFQIIAQKIAPQENIEGKLNAAYEALKAKLAEEGLFDFECKKEIPKHPKTIGIVTSKTGAVIHDIETTAHRRNPYVQLILYPCKVQGEGAAKTIIKGIEYFDKMGVDTIIIGRGGGSIEELWAFNEESLARAIFACKTPIISSVGHEVHNTISDYVADKRAATPTAAAELSVPDVMTDINRVRMSQRQMQTSMQAKLSAKEAIFLKVRSAFMLKSPERKTHDQMQKLDNIRDRLNQAFANKFAGVSNRFDTARGEMLLAMNNQFRLKKHRFEVLQAKMAGLDPTKNFVEGMGHIAKRGKDGEIGEAVRSVNDIAPGDSLLLVLHDGTVEADVKQINKKKLS